MRSFLAGFLGLASGVAISGAVYALIAAIGIVPHMAAKTKTSKHVKLYEEAIIWGGIFGAATMVLDITLPAVNLVAIAVGLACGVFFGVLVMSLAEELNVLPIMSKRLGVQGGVGLFVASLALGKLTGSLLYFIITGFFTQGA
ncbi:MAG: stage V sporulation protein AB [Defluviitaleaceae bacterium]|nr:stage V sporulation protein AB [Defluviitaleaceae bacterium]